MAFLTSRPDSDRSPSNAVNSSAVPVTRSPATTPTSAKGTTSQIASGWRSALNSTTTTTSTIARKPSGRAFARLAFASALSPCSPFRRSR